LLTEIIPQWGAGGGKRQSGLFPAVALHAAGSARRAAGAYGQAREL